MSSQDLSKSKRFPQLTKESIFNDENSLIVFEVTDYPLAYSSR